MKKCVWGSNWFCGNEVSAYGKEHGYIDYRTLAKAFDAVLANDIIPKTSGVIGYWETVNGDEARYYNEDGEEITREEYDENGGDEEYKDVYQYYIISANGYSILSDYTDEIVFYNEELDMYVWGVTHWGTSWDYVLTDIRIEMEDK